MANKFPNTRSLYKAHGKRPVKAIVLVPCSGIPNNYML